MERTRIKEITTIGILTALSVVLFSLIRIPLFGNIKLDLSYIVLTVAIVKCKMSGAIFVGGVGALIESMLYGVNVLTINKPIKQPINKPKININFLFCLIESS